MFRSFIHRISDSTRSQITEISWHYGSTFPATVLEPAEPSQPCYVPREHISGIQSSQHAVRDVCPNWPFVHLGKPVYTILSQQCIWTLNMHIVVQQASKQISMINLRPQQHPVYISSTANLQFASIHFP